MRTTFVLAVQSLRAASTTTLVTLALVTVSVLSLAATDVALASLARVVRSLAEQSGRAEAQIDVSACAACTAARAQSPLLRHLVDEYRSARVVVHGVGNESITRITIPVVCSPAAVVPRAVQWNSVSARGAWMHGYGEAVVLVGAEALPPHRSRRPSSIHTAYGAWRVAGTLRERPLLSRYAQENRALVIPERAPFSGVCARGVPSWRVEAADSAALQATLMQVAGELRTRLHLHPSQREPWQMGHADKLGRLAERLVQRFRRWMLLVPFTVALLCGAGVFSVQALESHGRVSEFGVRRAVGATRAALRAQVVVEGLLVMGAGVLIAAAMLATQRGDLLVLSRTVGLASAVVLPLMAVALFAPVWSALGTASVAALDGHGG